MIVVPLLLLSGILLPMSLAPRWLDALSRANPFRYIVEAIRAAFLGQYATGDVLAGVIVALVLAVLSVVIGARTFRRENV
jgi:ABC-2 type transport system permease protein